MTKDTQEILQGALILIPFLFLCWLIGITARKIVLIRYQRAFAPIAPLVEGVFKGSRGDWQVMAGRYRGHKVMVRINPNALVDAQTVLGNDLLPLPFNQQNNLFEIEVMDLPGAESWCFQYRVHALRNNDWGLTASDDALLTRLSETGVVEAIESMGHLPAVGYSARKKCIYYHENVYPRWAPQPDQFQKQLDLLMHLAEVNARVNAETGSDAKGGS